MGRGDQRPRAGPQGRREGCVGPYSATVEASKKAVEGFRIAQPPELTAIDVKEALDGLGEIVGETTTEDILDQIFSRFCLGK